MSYFELDDKYFFYRYKEHEKSIGTVVFLNGVMASATSWDFYSEALYKKGYSVLVHDFLGQLRSSGIETDYSLTLHARDVRALLKELDITSAHIVGTSYGAEVGMRLAIDYSDVVESLTLINATSELDDLLTRSINSWIGLAKSEDAETFMAGIVPMIYSESYQRENSEVLKKHVLAMAKLDVGYYAGQVKLYESFLRSVSMHDELYKIVCKTCVISSDEDYLKPPKFSRAIHEKITGSEYVMIPGCGHVSIYEKPEEVLTIVLGFLSKVR